MPPRKLELNTEYPEPGEGEVSRVEMEHDKSPTWMSERLKQDLAQYRITLRFPDPVSSRPVSDTVEDARSSGRSQASSISRRSGGSARQTSGPQCVIKAAL